MFIIVKMKSDQTSCVVEISITKKQMGLVVQGPRKETLSVFTALRFPAAGNHCKFGSIVVL